MDEDDEEAFPALRVPVDDEVNGGGNKDDADAVNDDNESFLLPFSFNLFDLCDAADAETIAEADDVNDGVDDGKDEREEALRLFLLTFFFSTRT